MSCSDMKYSEIFGQTVPGDSTLRMNQTKNRPVERSVASLFCWVTELKFDWLLSCYCTMESYFFEDAFLFHPPMFWRFIHDKCMIRRIDEKSCQIAEAKICFLKNYLTPLLWIAKTSATWWHKIASKSFDAFFPRKRRKVSRFQVNKLPTEKSADVCVLQSTNLPFAKILRKLGSRSLSTCPYRLYHWSTLFVTPTLPGAKVHSSKKSVKTGD